MVRLLPRIRKFLEEARPDALIVGAGFDAHREDDMSGLNFSVDVYRRLGSFVTELGRDLTGGRVVSILEGGYNLDQLGICAEAYLSGLVENNP